MSWLAERLTALAFLWRIERRDGVTIGFTSHDRDIVADGLLYRASPGMVPSAITRSDSLEPGGMEVSGALNAAAISEEDLAAGRFDGAAVTVSACDWTNPADAVRLCRGEIGSVAREGGGFTAELRGPAAILDRAVVEQTSPECRATLGDRRCRVDMAARRRLARVIDMDGDGMLTVDRTEPRDDAYGWGRLRWLDGDSAGRSGAIRRSAGATITLAIPPARVPAAGALVELIEGCDRQIDSCITRFGNAANFRGEPHLPGNDLLTRYPGS
ncbi:putative phage protein (TIGR02218 family) [Sphingomonas jejuensis]|uniref:Phage protein (TIGR02218 family) n=1 Tax=Sphingomonas jejuensis TaxID=904715 RepID=A0ABX0XJ11_9SPHN|nr:DUF2163 domain-containing protein [Sphingomonas jejuensis]NJC32829.1 putative phage protein (TIGR02218 family) [Sphingomonas jejuensis]